MLVLSRNVGERIVAFVGGLRIEVEVVEVSRDKIRLGLVGIKAVKFYRGELIDQIKRDDPDKLEISKAEFLQITGHVVSGLKSGRRSKRRPTAKR